jgi:hypothetical protein
MDSSCELLRSLDAARRSVHCYEVPFLRTQRSISKHQGGVAHRDVLCVSCLTEKTREAHRWVYVEARRALP